MAMAFQPAWQTDELKDEWPEEGDGVSELYTRSISLTIPVGSLHSPVHSGTGLSQDTDSDVADVVGTFLIRQDTFPALPQRLTAQKKGLIKDFFSPIALERMFDPPSPRTSVSPSSNPSARNDHSLPLQSSTILTSSITPIGDQEELTNRRPTSTSLRPDMSCPFTFSVPHPAPLTYIASSSPTQDRKATRTTTAVAPMTDPPLRLFQFQYDTFTRDHLSAMVDSIAVNSPSGSNTGNFLASTSSPFGLPPVSEASAHSSSIELRSAKRVKLSPRSDLHSLKSRTSSVVRRPVRRKDYVGESRFLMARIKSAKHSFSTPHLLPLFPVLTQTIACLAKVGCKTFVSQDPLCFFILTNLWAVALSRNVDSLGGCKDSVVTGPTSAFKLKGHSSLGYRQQAESLMAQLKQDMKGSKRIFSIDATDLSPDDASRSIRPITIPSPPYRTLQNQRNLTPTLQRGDSRKNSLMVALSSTLRLRDDTYHLKQDTSTTSNAHRIYAHFPAPPILVAPPPSPPPQPHPIPQRNGTVRIGKNALLPPSARTAAIATSSVLGRPSEDLNRFVSSSTVSGTTLTAGSSGSFVKHPGPAQITRIGPEDVPALPERVGRMVFDKVMMRWVKATVMESPRIPEGGGGGSAEIDAESEDPFRDIESLREDSLVGDGIEERVSQLMDNSDVDEVVDEEELELTSFSFDGPSHTHMPAASLSEDDTTDSDNDDDDVTEITALSASLSLVVAPEITSDPDSSDEESHHEHALAVVKSTPGPSREVSVPTPIRSVLKNTVASPAVTFADPVINSHCTPANKSGHRRSVSFSDGKREGPIRGLGRSTHVDSGDNALTGQVFGGDSPFEPSVWSKRIGEMLDGLESTKIGL